MFAYTSQHSFGAQYVRVEGIDRGQYRIACPPLEPPNKLGRLRRRRMQRKIVRNRKSAWVNCDTCGYEFPFESVKITAAHKTLMLSDLGQDTFRCVACESRGVVIDPSGDSLAGEMTCEELIEAGWEQVHELS